MYYLIVLIYNLHILNLNFYFEIIIKICFVTIYKRRIIKFLDKYIVYNYGTNKQFKCFKKTKYISYAAAFIKISFGN